MQLNETGHENRSLYFICVVGFCVWGFGRELFLRRQIVVSRPSELQALAWLPLSLIPFNAPGQQVIRQNSYVCHSVGQLCRSSCLAKEAFHATRGQQSLEAPFAHPRSSTRLELGIAQTENQTSPCKRVVSFGIHLDVG